MAEADLMGLAKNPRTSRSIRKNYPECSPKRQKENGEERVRDPEK